MELFKQGDKVEIGVFLILKQRIEIKAIATVVEDRRSEIKVKDDSGFESHFIHKAKYNEWKLLFKDMEDNLCTSDRGPSYIIRPHVVNVAEKGT